MIDIHSHILPGIDDGASNEEISIEMLRIAAKDGIKRIIATPHYIHCSIDNTNTIVHEKCTELIKLAKDEGIDIDIYPGNEVFLCLEIPQLIKEGQIATLNNSEYVLVELPMGSIPEYTDDVIYRLKLEGYTPIIAHPERYGGINDDPNKLYRMIKNGALAQLNAGSLKGMYGKKVERSAWTLLRHGLVHFISTDAHGCRGRSPKLNSCKRLVEREMGQVTAIKLFQTNAMNIIENRNIITEEPEPIKNKKTFFFKKWLSCDRIH